MAFLTFEKFHLLYDSRGGNTTLYRKAWDYLVLWKNRHSVLLIDGARQVGKSYLVNEFRKKSFASSLEVNLVLHPELIAPIEICSSPTSKDVDGLLLALSSLAEAPLVEGDTLIFIDEIQEAQNADLLTLAKFLELDGRYRFIFSGSLLGVTSFHMASYPVGYLETLKMFPLDFEEFLIASKIQPNVIDHLKHSFEKKDPIEETIHEKMMSLFYRYLLIGGMPEVVDKYLKTTDLYQVNAVFAKIDGDYRNDITKRADEEKRMYIESIYETIPESINQKNKRFSLSALEGKKKIKAADNDFIWISSSGVGIPVFASGEPKAPLIASVESRLMKLFASDVGLLDYRLSSSSSQIHIMAKDGSTNFGSIFENAAAQELNAHGYSPLFYYSKKSEGEVDFLIEKEDGVLPFEIKSGSRFKEHASLDKMLSNQSFGLKSACVFGECNLFSDGPITYFPIYLIGFLQNEKHQAAYGAKSGQKFEIPALEIPTI